jgi:hypothetical protein
VTVPRFARTILVSAPLTMLVALGCALAFLFIAPEHVLAQGSVDCPPNTYWNGCGCQIITPIVIDTTGAGFQITSAEAPRWHIHAHKHL